MTNIMCFNIEGFKDLPQTQSYQVRHSEMMWLLKQVLVQELSVYIIKDILCV